MVTMKKREDLDEMSYEVFLDHCDNIDVADTDGSCFPLKLQNYSFKPLRNSFYKGYSK